MRTNRVNLGQAFQLFKVQEAFAKAPTNTLLGHSLHQAIKDHRVIEAAKSLQDQIRDGNEQEVELAIGRSGVEAVTSLSIT